jgi:hypothetical protein
MEENEQQTPGVVEAAGNAAKQLAKKKAKSAVKAGGKKAVMAIGKAMIPALPWIAGGMVAVGVVVGVATYADEQKNALVSLLASDSDSDSSASIELPNLFGTVYVEHWLGTDAVHHDFRGIRYGITAEQIDGYLKATGINYNPEVVNGKVFLDMQKESGMDVRMFVAQAQMESSLGTAGVAATVPGANMFGYGAYNSNPENAKNYSNNDVAKIFYDKQYVEHQNHSFYDMEEHAKSKSEWCYWYPSNPETMNARASVMEKLDKWIDDHGGTPEPPGGYGPVLGGGLGNLTGKINERILAIANTYVGTGVHYGQLGTQGAWDYGMRGTTASDGKRILDCSYFVTEVLNKAGLSQVGVGGTTLTIKAYPSTVLQEISREQCQAGDIFCSDGHTGIFTGKDTIIHCTPATYRGYGQNGDIVNTPYKGYAGENSSMRFYRAVEPAGATTDKK